MNDNKNEIPVINQWEKNEAESKDLSLTSVAEGNETSVQTPVLEKTEVKKDSIYTNLGNDNPESPVKFVSKPETSPADEKIEIDFDGEENENNLNSDPDYDRKVLIIWAVIFVLAIAGWFGMKYINNTSDEKSSDEKEVITEIVDEKEEDEKDETPVNVILDCTGEEFGSKINIIRTYAPNKMDLLEVKTITTKTGLTQDVIDFNENLHSEDIYKNIDGYTETFERTDDGYILTSIVDLKKIPSGQVELGNGDGIYIDLLSYEDAKTETTQSGIYTCTTK